MLLVTTPLYRAGVGHRLNSIRHRILRKYLENAACYFNPSGVEAGLIKTNN